MGKWEKFTAVLSVLFLFCALLITNIYWWQAQATWQEKEVALSGQVLTSQYLLQVAEDKLADAQVELVGFRLEKEAELRELGLKLKSTETQLDNAVSRVFLLVEELQKQEVYFEKELVESENTGYWKGHYDALEGKVALENPTYAELMAFLKGTTLFPVLTDSCVDFAANLNNIAEEMGIRAGCVFLVYSYPQGGKWGHFLNCFETIDRGIVYIEPQTMKDVTREVVVGKLYSFGRQVIKEIVIIW
jgi:hypothetical protein